MIGLFVVATSGSVSQRPTSTSVYRDALLAWATLVVLEKVIAVELKSKINLKKLQIVKILFVSALP